MTILQVKLTDDERYKIDQAAKHVGMNPAEFIRTLLTLVEVKPERTRNPVRLHRRVLVQWRKERAWS